MSLTVKILEKQSGTLSRTAVASLGGLITSETTGYTSVNATITHNTTTHRWRVVGTGGTSVSLQYDTAVACSVGDVIFTTARVRVLTDGVDNIYARVDGTTAGSLSVASQASPVNGTYYDLYGTATITASETGNIRLRWWFYDASGATDTVMQVERWHAINLTAQFGAGDEPSAADLQTFFEWRWDGWSYPNYSLYTAYGDFLHYASKIASHGLEYNDVVYFDPSGHSTGHDWSNVYVLNTDWIITAGNTYEPGTTAIDVAYWTKTDYTSRLLVKTLQINMREDVDGNATLAFKGDSVWQPQLGMTVMFFDDTEALFTGHITRNSVTKINDTNWRCDCVVSSLLNTMQQQAFQVVTNDLGTYSTQDLIFSLLANFMNHGHIGLDNGGLCFWYGNIDTGNAAEHYVTPNGLTTMYAAMDALCTSAGLALTVTADRKVRAQNQTTTPPDAPRNITDAVAPNAFDMSYSEDTSSYGSCIIMFGGYQSDGQPAYGYYDGTPAISSDTFAGNPYKAVAITNSNIQNNTDATTAATNYYYQIGKVLPGEFRFTTTDTDYRPGQKIQIDIDCLGMTSAKTMLIDSVVLYDVDGMSLQSIVTCSNRDSTDFAAAPNKGPTAYMSELSSKVTQSVSAVQQSAGSFTPTLYGATTAGTWAYTTQEGYYIRIGNVCYISVRLNPSSISGAVGSLLVGGLPFAASSAATRYHLSAFATGLAWGTSMTQLQMPVTGGEQFGYLYGSANNAAWTVVGVADITTGDEIRISGVYLV